MSDNTIRRASVRRDCSSARSACARVRSSIRSITRSSTRWIWRTHGHHPLCEYPQQRPRAAVRGGAAVCDGQGLIGREMLAIDVVKLPSNASTYRSGTRAGCGSRDSRGCAAAARVAVHASDQPPRPDWQSAHEPSYGQRPREDGDGQRGDPRQHGCGHRRCDASDHRRRAGAWHRLRTGAPAARRGGIRGAKGDCAPCAMRAPCLRTCATINGWTASPYAGARKSTASGSCFA